MNMENYIPDCILFSADARDFMEGTMEKTNKMLAFLHPIIEEADPELEDFLIRYVLINHQTILIFNLLVVKYCTLGQIM